MKFDHIASLGQLMNELNDNDINPTMYVVNISWQQTSYTLIYNQWNDTALGIYNMLALKNKIYSMDAKEIWELLKGLVNNESDEAVIVYDIAVDVLETMVSEENMIRLFNELDNMMEY